MKMVYYIFAHIRCKQLGRLLNCIYETIRKVQFMSLTSILFLVILALFAVMITFVVDGLRTKNWKKAIISVVIFFVVVLLIYLGLLRFIASM